MNASSFQENGDICGDSQPEPEGPSEIFKKTLAFCYVYFDIKYSGGQEEIYSCNTYK